jgi:hypothetical protein
MTLKFQKSLCQGFTVLVLSGRFAVEHLEESEELFVLQNEATAIAFDLREIRLASRGAIKNLAGLQAHGVRIKNCPR